MAKETVPNDGPELAAETPVSGPTTGGAEIENLVTGLMEDPPEDAQDTAAKPETQDPPEEPAAAEETAKPQAKEDKELPFVPPQVAGEKEEGEKPVEDSDSTSEDDDGFVPPEVHKDTKAAHAWKSVKQERRQLRDKVKELEAALQERPKSEDAKTPEEVVALRTQVAELEQKLGEYDLSSTASFKQQFEQPIQQVVRRAASILTKTGKSAEEANALMTQLTDSSKSMDQIQDLIADEPIAIQGALMTAVGEFGDLAERRQEALQHWKDTKAALKDHESRETEVKLMQDVEQNTQAALQSVLEEGNWMYAETDNQEWNEQVQERVSAVKGILRSASREDLVKYVLEGATARPLRKMFEETYQLAEQRKAELDRLVAKQPGYRGAADDPKPKDRGRRDPDKPVAIQDAVEDVFAGVASARL